MAPVMLPALPTGYQKTEKKESGATIIGHILVIVNLTVIKTDTLTSTLDPME